MEKQQVQGKPDKQRDTDEIQQEERTDVIPEEDRLDFDLAEFNGVLERLRGREAQTVQSPFSSLEDFVRSGASDFRDEQEDEGEWADDPVPSFGSDFGMTPEGNCSRDGVLDPSTAMARWMEEMNDLHDEEDENAGRGRVVSPVSEPKQEAGSEPGQKAGSEPEPETGSHGMEGLGTVRLESNRLVLRRYRLDDAEELFSNYGSDPAVSRYVAWAPCETEEGTKEFLKMHVVRYDMDRDFYGWGIELKSTASADGKSHLIGSCGIFNVDTGSRSGELGLSIGSRWWRQGLAAEAMRTVMKFAFRQAGFHRLYASHQEDNTASGRVMRKCGMHFEGILRDGQRNRDGSYSNLLLYGKLDSDPAERS